VHKVPSGNLVASYSVAGPKSAITPLRYRAYSRRSCACRNIISQDFVLSQANRRTDPAYMHSNFHIVNMLSDIACRIPVH
jgi:hypothetical protein